MEKSPWKPNVTVAAIMERDGRYLLVEEETDEGIRFNQPAGHLECNESLIQAVVREAREETATSFTPTSLVGIYSWRHPNKDMTYLRFAFAGHIGETHPGQALDAGIIAARWLTYEEILSDQARHRSPLVLQVIDDYRAGRRYPLDLLSFHS